MSAERIRQLRRAAIARGVTFSDASDTVPLMPHHPRQPEGVRPMSTTATKPLTREARAAQLSARAEQFETTDPECIALQAKPAARYRLALRKAQQELDAQQPPTQPRADSIELPRDLEEDIVLAFADVKLANDPDLVAMVARGQRNLATSTALCRAKEQVRRAAGGGHAMTTAHRVALASATSAAAEIARITATSALALEQLERARARIAPCGLSSLTHVTHRGPSQHG